MSHSSHHESATVSEDVQPTPSSRLNSMFERFLQTARPYLPTQLLLVVAVILGPLQASAPAQDQRPSIEEAIDAWMLARAWVNELHVPSLDRVEPGQVGPVVDGASIVLRFRGRIIGVGDDYHVPEDALRRAVAEAVRDTRGSKRVRDLPFEMIEAIGREMYLNVFSRLPQEEEQEWISDYLAKNGERRAEALGDLTWALLNSAEFMFNH